MRFPFQNYVKLHPSEAYAWFALVIAYDKLGQEKDAKFAFQHVAGLEPDFLESYKETDERIDTQIEIFNQDLKWWAQHQDESNPSGAEKTRQVLEKTKRQLQEQRQRIREWDELWQKYSR